LSSRLPLCTTPSSFRGDDDEARRAPFCRGRGGRDGGGGGGDGHEYLQRRGAVLAALVNGAFGNEEEKIFQNVIFLSISSRREFLPGESDDDDFDDEDFATISPTLRR